MATNGVEMQHLVELACGQLRRSPYHNVRAVTCVTQAGTLVLRGCVSSYFEKQQAQEAVKQVDGVTELINQVEVAH